MPLFDKNPKAPLTTSAAKFLPPISPRKRILKIVWYVFLGLIAIGTIGEIAHGETSGFWLLALFGLPTLWLFKGLETRIKAIATGAFASIFLCSAIFSITPLGKAANASFHQQEAHDAQISAEKAKMEKAEDTKHQAQENKAAAKQKAVEAKEQAKQDAEQAKSNENKTSSMDVSAEEKAAPNIPVPETPNAEREIKILMKDQFGDALRYVNVAAREDGGYGVFVGFNIGNILPNGLARISIENDMKRAYKNLYTSDIDVHYASISAYGTTQDRFGNESNSNIYETNMMRDIGRKINWDNYSNLDFNDLWTIEIINPGIQQ